MFCEAWVLETWDIFLVILLIAATSLLSVGSVAVLSNIGLASANMTALVLSKQSWPVS